MSISKKSLNLMTFISRIVGTVSVIVTAVFLSFQLTNYTTAIENQGHYNALSIAQDPIVMMVDNAELASIVFKGNKDLTLLDPIQMERYYSYQFLSFNGWEYLYYANESRSIPSSLWIGAEGYFSELTISNPGIVQFWDHNHHAFAEPFKSYVSNFVDQAQVFNNIENNNNGTI